MSSGLSVRFNAAVRPEPGSGRALRHSVLCAKPLSAYSANLGNFPSVLSELRT